ncbi:MAG: hypothetical protein A2W19_00855 [Spirochaetes bacterium RBG_16_49_21]|nr:MAG: hypothetical protein A2W19_00855 [Spirochaetes bacterium RBG_16_49_21]
MKKMMITLLFVPLLFSALFAEEKAGADKKSEPVGLAAGIDYYSNYLWRGTRFFSGDGAFYPKVSWTVFGTGLVLSMSSEIASSWVFNGFSHKPGKYTFLVNSMPELVRKKLIFNYGAYAAQSLDFGADYSYTINNAVTLGASVWYWWYFNSRHAREYARPQVDGLNRVSYVDISFLTTAVSVGLPIVPFVNPTISLTHDYYTGFKRGGDYYVWLSLSHPFVLTKEALVTLGVTAGYYYSTTARLTRYNLMWDAASGAPDTTESVSYSGQTRTITWGGIKQTRTPLKKGFSDITPYLSATITKGPLTLNGGFYWCIVPSRTWYNGAEVHRFYAKVGVAYAI